MKHNRQLQQMAEDAMVHFFFENKPVPITQDDEPLEMPVHPEPKESVQPVCLSIHLQDHLPGNYFQQPPTAANQHQF